MQASSDQRKKETLAALFGHLTISSLLVFFTPFTLSLVPQYFFASSLLLQFALSVVALLLVLGFGRWCKHLLGEYSSAPAFVFCSILFIWLVYFLLVGQAILDFIDFVFNGEVVMLLIGLLCYQVILVSYLLDLSIQTSTVRLKLLKLKLKMNFIHHG